MSQSYVAISLNKGRKVRTFTGRSLVVFHRQDGGVTVRADGKATKLSKYLAPKVLTNLHY